VLLSIGVCLQLCLNLNLPPPFLRLFGVLLLLLLFVLQSLYLCLPLHLMVPRLLLLLLLCLLLLPIDLHLFQHSLHRVHCFFHLF